MSGSKVEGAARDVRNKIENAADDARREALSRIAAAASAASSTISGVADRVAATASDLGQDASQRHRGWHLEATMKDRPLTSMAVAGGIGLIIGFMMQR